VSLEEQLARSAEGTMASERRALDEARSAYWRRLTDNAPLGELVQRERDVEVLSRRVVAQHVPVLPTVRPEAGVQPRGHVDGVREQPPGQVDGPNRAALVRAYMARAEAEMAAYRKRKGRIDPDDPELIEAIAKIKRQTLGI
jgi:hypothetical protein